MWEAVVLAAVKYRNGEEDAPDAPDAPVLVFVVSPVLSPRATLSSFPPFSS
jgi:hypothetical protein